jgi:hypothetical protein
MIVLQHQEDGYSEGIYTFSHLKGPFYMRIPYK